MILMATSPFSRGAMDRSATTLRAPASGITAALKVSGTAISKWGDVIVGYKGGVVYKAEVGL